MSIQKLSIHGYPYSADSQLNLSAKQLKKEKQSAEEKHVSEDSKRKATITSLQQLKKQMLAELKAEASAIDSKIEAGNHPH